MRAHIAKNQSLELKGAVDCRTGVALQDSPHINNHNAVGNQMMLGIIQAKLKVGAVNDPTEREADRVAAAITGGESIGQMQGGSESPGGMEVQRSVEGAGAGNGFLPDASFESGISASGGRTLEARVRENIGRRLGADFSGVRIHTDENANKLSDSIEARAFTTGRDIYFAKGQYQPESTEGQSLLAHELTHTIQQGAVEQSGGSISVQQSGDSAVVQRKGGFSLKNLFGRGKKKPDAASPAPLDMSKQGKLLKEGSVASFPTTSGDSAVVKAFTNPEVEAALADFYNASGSVRSQKRDTEWNFDAPAARKLGKAERPGIGSLYNGEFFRKKAMFSGPELDEDTLLDTTTVFSKVAGKSQQANPEGPLGSYQETMGYIGMLDLVTGNGDRLNKYLNRENWLEDRDKKQIHLIDQADQRTESIATMKDKNNSPEASRKAWLANLIGKTGGENPSGGSYAQRMLDQHAANPEAAGLFDIHNTSIGATQAVEDLPAIHAALSKKYAAAAPAALGGHRAKAVLESKETTMGGHRAKAAAAAALAAPMGRNMNPHQKEILERIQLMHEMLKPKQQ